MGTTNVVRIAIASDLHAFANLDPSPSHLDIELPESVTLQHPIEALIERINLESDKLNADILLSPGDLGHAADPKGIAYSWHALEKIARALNCEVYTATAGNHDVDSRYKGTDHDPDHILKGLSPSFPLQNETLDDRYWARTYTIHDGVSYRLVVLNSSAFHGNNEIEKNHGRIDLKSLERLKHDLASLQNKQINVLLCHHHPHSHSEYDLGEGDVMKQGQLLLDLLGSGQYGRWLVVHGHKHHPKIAYAAGGSNSPVVFGAGSLCSILAGKLQTVARNQFYIIDMDTTDCERYGLVGRVRAWDWYPGRGWIEASTNSGLPAEFGFGERRDPVLIAKGVTALVNASPDSVPWSTILEQLPNIAYLLPQDLSELVRILERDYPVLVTWNGTAIVEVGRRI
jgi:3',5'-cyclic AMP phosphodiesterase CpdA